MIGGGGGGDPEKRGKAKWGGWLSRNGELPY